MVFVVADLKLHVCFFYSIFSLSDFIYIGFICYFSKV